METKNAQADSASKRRSPLLELLDFAGSRKRLAFAGCALAAASGVLVVVPYVLVWHVVSAFVSVAPHWERASDVAPYAWAALAVSLAGALVYAAALMLTIWRRSGSPPTCASAA